MAGRIERRGRAAGRVLWPRRWLVETLVGVLLVSLAYGSWRGWQSADAVSRGFPESLSLLPPPRPAGGYLALTAQALGVRQPTRRDLGVRVRYVTADRVSSGPFVISVHPINTSTWTAVARGANGRCYGILESRFNIYYAAFAMGVPCEGRRATPRTVRSKEFPR